MENVSSLILKAERFSKSKSKSNNNKRIDEGKYILLELRKAGQYVSEPMERTMVINAARDLSLRLLQLSGEYYSPQLYDLTEIVNVNSNDRVGNQVEMRDRVLYQLTPPDIVLYQLPTPTADFVGREGEIALLLEMIKERNGVLNVAIVGLQGMGGVGKTQLALVVGYQLRSRFPLQIQVDLQGSREQPLPVEAALQTVLRVFRPDEKLPENIQELHVLYQSELLKQPALIFADDAFDAAQITALRPPPGSVLLVTSRFDIDVTDFEMTVLDLGVLPKGDAVELLQKINAALSKEVAEELAELCGRLPLALRVSAVVTKRGGRTPEEWVTLLRDERQRLRRMADRKTNMDVEASLRYSYVQLEPHEQQSLAQLGLMVTSFDRSAAEAIISLDDGFDVVDCLDRLEEANLLDRDDAGRYAFHELVRVFALARLREQGEDAERATHLRHARHYIAVAAQADQLFLQGGENIAVGLTLFDREQQQFDAARAWLQNEAEKIGNKQLPVAENLHAQAVDVLLIADADATAHIGDLRYPKLVVDAVGQRSGRIPQIERALGSAQRLGQRSAQGALLGNLGLAYAALGDARRAISFYEQHLTVAREIGDRRGEGNGLGNLGNAYAALGDVRRAISFYEQCLVIAREIGDRRGEGNGLGNLGNAYAALGDVRRAISFYEQCLVIAREIGDRQGEGAVLGNLGNAYAALGDARRAISFYEQRLVIAREIGDRQGEGNALGNLGNAYAALGDARRAISFYEQNLTITREIGDRRGEGAALGNLGNAYAALGDVRRAISFYEQCLVIAREIGDRQGEAETSWNYGVLLAQQGEREHGLELMRACLQFEQEVGHPRAAEHATLLQRLEEGGALDEPSPPEHNLDDLPEAVQQALRQGDSTALQAALEALRAEEATAIIERLERAGIISTQRGPDMARVLREYEPLLRGIAAVARGDDAPRAEIEEALPRLEENGWQLAEATRRIWAGERDEDALTEDIDARSAQLVARVLAILAEPAEETEQPSVALSEAVQDALRSGDVEALEQALAALPDDEQARVRDTVQRLMRQTVDQLDQLDPQQLVASLPQAIQEALAQQDAGAFQAALAALPQEQQQAAAATLTQLQARTALDTQREQQRDPRERFASLLRDIARVAVGDEQPREQVEQALDQLQGNGWMLLAPARQIWSGERHAASLTEGLDEQDTALVERVLELVGEYERGERQTPVQLLAELPEPVRAAIEQRDEAAYEAAMAALPGDERQRVQALLAALQDDDEEQESAPQPTTSQGPDIPRVLQQFAPLLGDIALASFDDEVARALAEEELPRAEQAGWRLAEPSRRIWGGEQDFDTLAATIDKNSAYLVRRVLDLIALGKDFIVATRSQQLANIRQQAERAAAQALGNNDTQERAALAQRFEELAQQAEGAAQSENSPWLALARDLRVLAGRLSGGDAA